MKLRNFFLLTVSLAFAVLSINTSFAQEKEIDKKDLPKDVLTSFQKSYPDATIKGAATEKEEGKTYYEIESTEGSIHRDILYTKEGKVVEVEESLTATEIPDLVKNSVMKEYPKCEINKAEKVTKAGKTNYELKITKGEQKYEVVLDSKGNIQKVEKMKKENEEKEGKENEKY
jgi:hypothetical protein